MTITREAEEIFADASYLYRAALERLEAGDIRDAAEKAWGATQRATDAMILSRKGRRPGTSGGTYRTIRAMRNENEYLANLANRYSQRANDLHGNCFYDGICEPEEAIIEDIRATGAYIDDARAIANL